MLWPTKKRKPTVAAEPTERDIFKFWDGSESRLIDPLPVWYRLWQTEDIDTLMNRAANNEMEAAADLVRVARDLFGLADYDPNTGAGLTELEVQRVFMQFLQYCDELKKKHGPLPMPWQKLAPKSSETSTTPPVADSFFSPSESPSDAPSINSTPSPQPSTAP